MAQRVTVGIVVYKTPVAALQPLFALLQQTPQVAQVLIFDNGPDPALQQDVEARGWVYRSAGGNLGFGSGHNRLLAELAAWPDADLHLLCNPDISWQDNPLPPLLDYLDAHPGVAAVMPDVYGPDGQRQYLAKREPTPFLLFGRRFLPGSWLARRIAHYELRHEDFSQPMQVPIVSGCFMLLRRAALLDVGGFDERYFLYLEDYDLCRRLRRRGHALALVPAARVEHQHARASYSWGLPLWWHIRSAVRYFWRRPLDDRT